jgi:amino acid transporter
MQEPELNSPAPSGAEQAKDLLRRPRIKLGSALAAVIAAVFVAWAVIGGGGSSSKPGSTPTVTAVGPVGLSVSGLRRFATRSGRPIYWAGAQEGYFYELTRTSENNVYVRYLPPDANVGAKRADFLVIATYPFPNALQALRNVADGHEIRLPGGGIASVNAKHPSSVYLAYPGVEYQIEVYDPSPARSLQVARSGTVRPVR